MARPSKLTPDQWQEIEGRILRGEPLRSIGKDFGVTESTIRSKFGGAIRAVIAQSAQVREIAHQVAEVQDAVENLPPFQRDVVFDLAASLRNVSRSLTKAAELGADTSMRLQEMASTQIRKVNHDDPTKSIEELKSVGIMTRLANDSASIALNLLAANKDRMPAPEAPKASGLAKRLSSEALREIVAAKNAAD